MSPRERERERAREWPRESTSAVGPVDEGVEERGRDDLPRDLQHDLGGGLSGTLRVSQRRRSAAR